MSQILCRAVTKTLPISDALNYILIAKYHIFNARLNDHTPSHEKNGYQFTSHKDFVMKDFVTKTLWLTLAVKLAKKLATKLEAYRGAKS